MSSINWIPKVFRAHKFSLALGCSLLVWLQSGIAEERHIDLGVKSIESLKGYQPLSDDEETQVLDSVRLSTGNRFLYDAQAIGFDKDGKKYRFQGDVVHDVEFWFEAALGQVADP